jgi:hypothetical protein
MGCDLLENHDVEITGFRVPKCPLKINRRPRAKASKKFASAFCDWFGRRVVARSADRLNARRTGGPRKFDRRMGVLSRGPRRGS